MPTRTKNQIRPRRDKWHFTNAEILLFDTTAAVQLVAPPALGQILQMEFIQVRTNIVQVYGAVGGVDPFISFIDDFTFDGIFFEDFGGLTNFSDLFAQTGMNVSQSNGNELALVTATVFIDPRFVTNWNDPADAFANGGIFMFMSNDGADLNGGDPANFLDVFIDYKIIDL